MKFKVQGEKRGERQNRVKFGERRNGVTRDREKWGKVAE